MYHAAVTVCHSTAVAHFDLDGHGLVLFGRGIRVQLGQFIGLVFNLFLRWWNTRWPPSEELRAANNILSSHERLTMIKSDVCSTFPPLDKPTPCSPVRLHLSLSPVGGRLTTIETWCRARCLPMFLPPMPFCHPPLT